MDFFKKKMDKTDFFQQNPSFYLPDLIRYSHFILTKSSDPVLHNFAANVRTLVHFYFFLKTS